jgi:hypothetical protein
MVIIAFKFTLEYTIPKAHKNQEGLELNRKHELLVYADDSFSLRVGYFMIMSIARVYSTDW